MNVTSGVLLAGVGIEEFQSLKGFTNECHANPIALKISMFLFQSLKGFTNECHF